MKQLGKVTASVVDVPERVKKYNVAYYDENVKEWETLSTFSKTKEEALVSFHEYIDAYIESILFYSVYEISLKLVKP